MTESEVNNIKNIFKNANERECLQSIAFVLSVGVDKITEQLADIKAQLAEIKANQEKKG